MAVPKIPLKAVKQIRTLHAFGISITDLAKRYKVSYPTMHRAINGIGKGYTSVG